MELGWIYPKRKKLLEDLVAKPSGRTQGINFQGKFQEFSKYTVQIGVPKYRLNNGRTYASQIEYLAKNIELPKDFFASDPESDSAHKAQHELLKEMAGDSHLLEYFKDKNHKQEEPLILTHEGFVLNGNRRLCAMRELLESDQERYNNFGHIDVVILPTAHEKDLDELEASLQIHEDIKAPYKWTAFALMLRERQQEHGYTSVQLAQLYEKKNSEINEYTDMLDYAEDYLKQRNRPGEYHLVDQDEFAFRQIRKKRTIFNTEQEKEIFEKLSFALIDNPEGGRLYGLIPDVAKYSETIISQIDNEIEITQNEEKEEKEASDEDVLGGKDTVVSRKLENIISVLDEEKNRTDVREIIIDVIDGEKAKEKEKKKENFVFAQIKKASSNLSEAANEISDNTSKSGIKEHIDAIETLINKLKAWLNG